ncbi:MAG: glycosyltransferase family 4 protein [bacterium]
MRIGVNARFLLKDKLEGIGWFSYETLIRITREHTEYEFYFFFDRPYHKDFLFSKNITPIILYPPARHPFLFYLFFEWSLPFALKKYKIDYFISPDGFLPLKSKVPSLAVIHDIAFEHRSTDVGKLMLKYYRYYFPKFANKASRIATVSEYSKQDIIQTYKISKNKIDVVYNGSNELYKPLDKVLQENTKTRYSNNCDYFVYVGSLNPRKNIANLLKAFDEFKKNDSTNKKLLIVGKVMVDDNHFKSVLESMQFEIDVLFTGRIPNEELHHVLASAIALVYIPFYEGFGIPILEAFNCNTPVITSNVTSLPEVANDAALLVDPNNVNEIAKSMHLILDSSMRDNLKAKMKVRVTNFSWDNTARLLWNSFEKMTKEIN